MTLQSRLRAISFRYIEQRSVSVSEAEGSMVSHLFVLILYRAEAISRSGSSGGRFLARFFLENSKRTASRKGRGPKKRVRLTD